MSMMTKVMKYQKNPFHFYIEFREKSLFLYTIYKCLGKETKTINYDRITQILVYPWGEKFWPKEENLKLRKH